MAMRIPGPCGQLAVTFMVSRSVDALLMLIFPVQGRFSKLATRTPEEFPRCDIPDTERLQPNGHHCPSHTAAASRFCHGDVFLTVSGQPRTLLVVVLSFLLSSTTWGRDPGQYVNPYRVDDCLRLLTAPRVECQPAAARAVAAPARPGHHAQVHPS